MDQELAKTTKCLTQQLTKEANLGHDQEGQR